MRPKHSRRRGQDHTLTRSGCAGKAEQQLQAPRPPSSICKRSCCTWNHSLRPIFAKQFKQVQSPVELPGVLIKVWFPSDLLSHSFLTKCFYGPNMGTQSTATNCAVANQTAWEYWSCARSLACYIPSKRCSFRALQPTPPLLLIY